jgi:hypothetical protein
MGVLDGKLITGLLALCVILAVDTSINRESLPVHFFELLRLRQRSMIQIMRAVAERSGVAVKNCARLNNDAETVGSRNV